VVGGLPALEEVILEVHAFGSVYIGKACSGAPSVPKKLTSAPSAKTR
jgi:hypothetical protein